MYLDAYLGRLTVKNCKCLIYILPIVIRSWQDNWDKLSEYFQYTPAIRKLIYTTNTVEEYHRQIRKVTKNKGVFPSDTALEKTGLSCIPQYTEEMDHATCQLGLQSHNNSP